MAATDTIQLRCSSEFKKALQARAKADGSNTMRKKILLALMATDPELAAAVVDELK